MTIIPYTKDKNTRKIENITKKAIDSLKGFVHPLSNDFVRLITNEIKNGEFELSIYKYLFNPIVDFTNKIANNLKIKSI